MLCPRAKVTWKTDFFYGDLELCFIWCSTKKFLVVGWRLRDGFFFVDECLYCSNAAEWLVVDNIQTGLCT